MSNPKYHHLSSPFLFDSERKNNKKQEKTIKKALELNLISQPKRFFLAMMNLQHFAVANSCSIYSRFSRSAWEVLYFPISYKNSKLQCNYSTKKYEIWASYCEFPIYWLQKLKGSLNLLYNKFFHETIKINHMKIIVFIMHIWIWKQKIKNLRNNFSLKKLIYDLVLANLMKKKILEGGLLDSSCNTNPIESYLIKTEQKFRSMK